MGALISSEINNLIFFKKKSSYFLMLLLYFSFKTFFSFIEILHPLII